LVRFGKLCAKALPTVFAVVALLASTARPASSVTDEMPVVLAETQVGKVEGAVHFVPTQYRPGGSRKSDATAAGA
jgi:hypothetical protein